MNVVHSVHVSDVLSNISNSSVAPDVVDQTMISKLVFALPVRDAEKDIQFGQFYSGENQVRKFSTNIKSKFAKPLESKWGKSIKVSFDPVVRKQFAILKSRIAIAQDIDPNSIKNPIDEDNMAYLKLGEVDELPLVDTDTPVLITFGINLSNRGLAFHMSLRK